MQPGTILSARYVIGSSLGQGGMGTAYRATDLLTEDDVALKIVDLSSPELLGLFREEFTILRGLTHPRLVKVRDFGQSKHSGEVLSYYTADLIHGEPLGEISFDGLRLVLGDILEALGFLHALGIIHGDVKPQNILVDEQGRATLIDLGCARPVGSVEMVSATPGFVAPEVMKGAPADPRVDIYALGITVEGLRPHLASPLPPELHRLLARMIAESPEVRPSDADEILEALGLEKRVVVPARSLAGRQVGREAELERFEHVLESLTLGRDGVRGLFIEGQDGIGRSRLLCEMKWRAQLEAQVVEGSVHGSAPVQSLLARALGVDELAKDLSTLLQQKDDLCARGEPMVLIFDDAHLLVGQSAELLDALLRSQERTAPILFVVAGRHATVSETEALELVRLEPLSRGDVELWAAEVLAPIGRVDEILRFTGGFPAYIQAVFAQQTIDVTSDLGALVFESSDQRWASELRRRLSEQELDLLGFLALHDEGLGPQELEELAGVGDGIDANVSLECAARLNQGGWAKWDRGQYGLARRAEAASILSALGPARLERLRKVLVDWLRYRLDRSGLDVFETSGLRARLVGHLAHLGLVEEAETLFLEKVSWSDEQLDLWRGAISTLVAVSVRVEIHLAAADRAATLGHPEQALSFLESLVQLVQLEKLELSERESNELRLQGASCAVKLGRGGDAQEWLDQIQERGCDDAVLVRVADLRSKACIKLGDYRRAREVAEAVLETVGEDDAIEAALRLDAGLASSFLGDIDGARAHLGEAEGLYDGLNDARGRILVQSYRALAEYRVGNLGAASEGYREVLEIAEQQGKSDQIATASLNLGTVRHQLGDLGGAASTYDRGLPLASALGMVSTEVTLLFDKAMLFLDVGLFERALTATDSAESKARLAGIDRVVTACGALRGEVLLVQGDHKAALKWLDRSRGQLQGEGALREVAEIDLHRVEAMLGFGEVRAASDLLRDTSAALGEIEADDLLARAALLRSRIFAEGGEPSMLGRAIDEVEKGIEIAQKIGKRLLEAEVRLHAARVFEVEGASYAASTHVSRSRELLDRLSTTLPRQWRAAFFRHPRYQLPAESPATLSRDPEAPSGQESMLRRLLEINKRLNSTLDSKEVLGNTMDAAIELTGAERGFVILDRSRGSEEPVLEVPVARNLDREGLNRSHLKFSGSIARSVIESGEPMVTVDAASDVRFEGNRSIHAMRLKSVMCVPIRSRDRTIGALYLDNRFQRGRFTEEETGLLLAFADQAALALDNARLHGELKGRTAELMIRTRELEAERARVAELVADQAHTIERLNEELRVGAQQQDLRHDFSAIVGVSPAMRAVFQKLDRVIDTPLTVLIQGESGTGKELCAQAIHINGPRRDGPFVSLNCGALPETLLEAELFGHVKGAFTGATADRAGVFQAAREGTLFLDEVGEMPKSMQVKLLRVSQEHEVVPVGGDHPVAVDVRLVCATNRKLSDEVRAGRFRADLYYRLAVVEIQLPPLRDRIEDVRPLTDHFLSQIEERLGRCAPSLERSAWKALGAFPWPGNVRQLENILTRAVVFSEAETMRAADLQLPVATGLSTLSENNESNEPVDRQSYEQQEASMILTTLRTQGWNVRKTAELLGVPRSTMYNKMRRYGIHRSKC